MVMGVINVTPDSFSDGGLWLDPAAAVDRALQLAADGAAILDVGGESSRPGAFPIPTDEELRRVVPVIRELARRLDLPVSVDTRKPSVADAALDAGAEIVNDISGLRDPAMAALVARSGAAVVTMHMRGTPETMQQLSPSPDILEDVHGFFESVLHLCVDPVKIILDPGIGFGKTVKDNLVLLNRLGHFSEFGRPILVGASRKSFIGKVSGAPVQDRLGGSVAAAVLAAERGAAILRCHDVRETVQALRVARAVRDESEG